MSNQTYAELLAKREELRKLSASLDKQLENARRESAAEAIKQIKMLMTQHGITAQDLGQLGLGKQDAKHANAGVKVAPKYKHPVTGETWTGRGIKPKWMQNAIAQGATMESFKI